VSVRFVRLGGPRAKGEGLRIGTVRRPPREVPKAEIGARDFYDVWLPELAPSAALVKSAQAAAGVADWAKFARAYRREMAVPAAARALDLLAALSHQTDFAVGCYCSDETRCHRAVLCELLAEHGARVA
jgi:uncharacterized protein YeaO (DUF488 family)